MFRFILLKVAFVTGFVSICTATSYDERTVYTQALLTVRYNKNPSRKNLEKVSSNGKYAKESPKSSAKGNLYFKSQETWCRPFKASLHGNSPWIALIPRENSSCPDSQKILEAIRQNFTAVIIYNSNNDEVPVITDNVHSMKTVMIDLTAGTQFVEIFQNYPKSQVDCEILVGTHYVDRRWKVSRTSVLFVLVSFILLMCISLAWLVFYYVQRFRHIYRNDRKEKQLLNAAKKAISKLKTHNYQDTHEEEEEDSCAVCLDNYKDGETLRILPCKHQFHKGCIDPWLLNHRTCPMCKSNILKSLGVEMPESVNFQTEDFNEQMRTNLRIAGLSSFHEPEATIVTVVTSNNANRYSSSSGASDTDSDRSTVALVSNPRTV